MRNTYFLVQRKRNRIQQIREQNSIITLKINKIKNFNEIANVKWCETNYKIYVYIFGSINRG